MKTLIQVLSLGLVLVYGQDPQSCGQSLGPEELNQVGGSWVLVGVVFDKVKSERRSIPHVTSSHLEVKVHPDNRSLTVQESSTVGGKCVSFLFNMSLSETGQRQDLLHLYRTEMFVDGDLVPIDDRANVQVFSTSGGTIELVFRGDNGEQLLAKYSRDGLPVAVEKVQEDLRAKTKCLGLSGDNYEEWIYSGHSDFCNKISTSTVESMSGSWVLVSLVYDKVRSRNRNIPPMRSSRLEVEVQADNRTVKVTEDNSVGSHCCSTVFELRLPEDERPHQRIPVHRTTAYIDGRMYPINERATLQFFLGPENTLMVLHKSQQDDEQLLPMYRKPDEVNQNLLKILSQSRAKAESLGLSGGNYDTWTYDGTSGFCSGRS